MRRNLLWLLSTVVGVVLLFTYRPPDNETEAPSSPVAGATSVDGALVQTEQGPVQVRITVAGRTITDVTAVVYPDSDQRHRQVSSYALPLLRQSALAAQSADIDTVSGATATSEGYRKSLQAAIDAAYRS
jgi:uncharacterized protein with FMN-binding domain